MDSIAIDLQQRAALIHYLKMQQSEHLADVWIGKFTCPNDCLGSLSTCTTIHYRFTKEQIVQELQKSATLEYFSPDGVFGMLLQLAYEEKWECYPLVYSVIAHFGKYLWPEKWNREQDPFYFCNYF
jgi:hypothetical protein